MYLIIFPLDNHIICYANPAFTPNQDLIHHPLEYIMWTDETKWEADKIDMSKKENKYCQIWRLLIDDDAEVTVCVMQLCKLSAASQLMGDLINC